MIEDAPTSTREGRTELLLEEIKAQNRATIEAVYSIRDQLTLQMQEQERRLGDRIAVLEMVARANSADIRQNTADISRLQQSVSRLEGSVSRLEVRMSDLEREVAQMRQDFGRIVSKDEHDALERRVSALERKLEIVP